MFPDSKIADEYACGATKTKALVIHALAPTAKETVTAACQTQQFTILCDGGNDNFKKKYFGVMVRFWDNQLEKVVPRFLDVPVCYIATGATLFDALSGVLSSRHIP